MTGLWVSRVSIRVSRLQSARNFSSTAPRPAKNRVYSSVRYPADFDTLTLLSASSNTSLITLWAASWCPSCKVIRPLLKEIIEEGVGEKEGGVGYAEVELDAMTIGDLPMRYRINSIPSLLAFSRQEAQMETMMTRLEDLKSRKFLTEWIENEARRGGQGGSGGSLFGGLFGR